MNLDAALEEGRRHSRLNSVTLDPTQARCEQHLEQSLGQIEVLAPLFLPSACPSSAIL